MSLATAQDLITVPSIADLIAYPPSASFPIDDKMLVYVEGYYLPGDGGGGIFMFDETVNIPENYGVFIKSTNSHVSTTATWIRQYEGPINVMYFGVTQHLVAGAYPYNAKRIEFAIKFASQMLDPTFYTASDDLTIYFPSGAYWIDAQIELPSFVHLKGDTGTELWLQYPIPEPKPKAMFVIAEGPVEHVRVENFTIDLGAKRGETYITAGAFHFIARPKPPITEMSAGGLAFAVLRDINIRNASGDLIYMKGSNSDILPGRLINQYVYFENVRTERYNGDARCLKMEGEQVNLSFIGCGFGMEYVAESDKYIDPIEGMHVEIKSVSSRGLDNNCSINFINCDTGGTPGRGARLAFSIKNADNITFDNCWFEDTITAIRIENSDAINILNSRFANAAGQGSLKDKAPIADHSGQCILIEDSEGEVKGSSFVTVERNYTLVSNPQKPWVRDKQYFIRDHSTRSTVNARNNAFDHVFQSQTTGLSPIQDIRPIECLYDPAAPPYTMIQPGIDTEGRKVVLVRTLLLKFPDLYRINSKINAGETLFITAEDADIMIFAMDPSTADGRNLILGSKSSFLLKKGESATFMKLDIQINDEKGILQLMATF